MITEHALLPVRPSREDEFEIAFAEAQAIIASMPGCRGLSLSRSIEPAVLFIPFRELAPISLQGSECGLSSHAFIRRCREELPTSWPVRRQHLMNHRP